MKTLQKLKTTNAEILVKTLIDLGVKCIFGYPGASVLSIYNELSKTDKINHYLVRHEQAALHAAEGYARVSGHPGVVIVTSGPGFTNTITGITNAYKDSTPLIVLAGDVSAGNNKRKSFQSIDIISMCKNCTKKVFMLSENDDIIKILKKAFEIADSGVKGPVVIAMPRNIMESKYQFDSALSFEKNDFKIDFFGEINKFNQLLYKAKRPLILVGGGAINASSEIFKFATSINCPIVSTLMGIGIFPSENPLYLGMIGMNGSYTANTTLNNCDLLISFGASFSDRSTCKNKNFGKTCKIIDINIDKIYDNYELCIKADVNDFLNYLLETKITYKTRPDWLEKIKIIKSEDCDDLAKTPCLHSSQVLAAISEFTKEYEPIVVTDVGQHQMLTAQYFKFNKPRKFITSGGLGTMGFGLPASIGAHIANPNSLILNITGDGSFR